MALYGLVFLGSTPVGGPIIGWVSQHWGSRAGLAVGGLSSVAAAVAAAVPVVLVRRRGGSTVDDAAAAAAAVVEAGGGGELPLAPTPGGGISPGDPVEAA
jgi:hypothetical protein